MKTRREVLIIALAVTGVFLSCGHHDDPGEFLRRETMELQGRTVPPGSEVLAGSDSIQDGWSNTAHWQFETDWDWTQYKEWVTSELRPQFGGPRIDGSRLVFVRSREGDTEEVEIAGGVKASKLRVSVTLATYPD